MKKPKEECCEERLWRTEVAYAMEKLAPIRHEHTGTIIWCGILTLALMAVGMLTIRANVLAQAANHCEVQQ